MRLPFFSLFATLALFAFVTSDLACAAATRVSEIEPNNLSTAATALNGSGPFLVTGNVFPANDEDYYAFAAAAGDRVYAAVITSFDASVSGDSVLTLLGTDGTAVIEEDNNDGTFNANSSTIAGAQILQPGTYYLRVRHNVATGTIRPYDLYVQVRSGAPVPEVEPNDLPATPNPAQSWVAGAWNPAQASEQDWYPVTLNAGDTVFLSLDCDPERDATTWNGRLGLYGFGDAGDQTIIANDTNATSPNSEVLAFTVKNAGTYFAVVDSLVAAGGGPTATYHLNVSVIPPIEETWTTYTSTNVPVTIPSDAPGLVSSTITIPGNPRIKKLRVRIDLNHTFMQDLDVHLRSPAGDEIGLFSDIGSGTSGVHAKMDVIFSDEAALPPLITFTTPMILRPEAAYRLGWMKGVNAGGTWTLDIRDDATNDGGTLNSWSLEIIEEDPLPTGAATVVFASDFESGTAGFTHSGTQDEWELGTPTAAPIASANSGVNCWKTDLDDNYNASASADLLSPIIDLSNVPSGIPIVFEWAMKYHMESANFDHLSVAVEEAGGANPIKVFEWLDATMNNAVGNNPVVTIAEAAGWGRHRARIDAFAGKMVQLRFHYDTDSTVLLKGMAIDDVSVTTFGNVTQPPVLTAPGDNTLTKSPVAVAFELPEAALAGSVKLTFAGTEMRVLTLAASEETATTHSFTFNPANPAGTVKVASISGGTSIPDGLYTVTLSYQNAAGRPLATDVSTNVRIDTTPPTASAEPIALVAGPTGLATLGDQTGKVTASDSVTATANLMIGQSPNAAAVLGLGEHGIAFTVTDEAGNLAIATTSATVAFTRPAVPTATSWGTAGPVVAGFGTGDLAPLPQDTTLSVAASMGAFFTPAISNVRSLVARATILDKKKYAAIYTVDGAGTGFIPAYQTGEAPDEAGLAIDAVTYKSFRDPVIAPGGAIAFVAKLQGIGAKAGDDGVWSDVFATPGDLRLLLRENTGVPGFADGETLKSAISLSVRDGELLALITLGGPKSAGVTAKNDSALVVLTGAQAGQALLREGKELDGFPDSSIKSFSVLQPALGSAGQGRWHGDGATLAKVTLADKTVLLVSVDLSGAVTPLLSTTDEPSAAINGFDPAAKWKSFSIPAMGCDGVNFAVAATLQAKTGTVTTKDDTALLFSIDGSAWQIFARENDLTPISAPNDGPRYATFFDPVANEAGDVAFLATLQGTGVTAKNKAALFSGPPGSLTPVIRLGDFVPNEAGTPTQATLNKFAGYALPSPLPGGTADIVFVAETKGGDTTAKNKLALFGRSSTGQLCRLLRTGSPVVNNGPNLTSFTLLNALPGSYGVARSYNETGSVAVVATFADKTQSLLRIDIP